MYIVYIYPRLCGFSQMISIKFFMPVADTWFNSKMYFLLHANNIS